MGWPAPGRRRHRHEALEISQCHTPSNRCAPPTTTVPALLAKRALDRSSVAVGPVRWLAL